MANKAVADLNSASTLTGTELLYGDDGSADVKITADQVKTFCNSDLSSASVSFTQAGTGAVERTAQAKLRERVSVLDFIPTSEHEAIQNETSTLDVTSYIQAAIDYVNTLGGGYVYFPRGQYIVHLATLDTSSATLWTCALKCPYDDIILEGDGIGLTTIKSQTGGSYGTIQFIETPLEAGVTKVFRSGMRNMTIDGNYDQASGASSVGKELIAIAGGQDCVFEYLHVKNGSHYGIGIQNGGHKSCRYAHLIIEKTGQDGIDVKNNGNIGVPLIFDDIKFRGCGRGTDANGFVCLDLKGPGNQVSNIRIESFPEDVGATVAGGVRVKSGLDGDNVGDGDGGQYNLISNVYMTLQAGAVAVSNGVDIRAPYCSVANISVVGAFDTGVSIEQPHTKLTNAVVDGATTGFKVGAITANSSQYPYTGGADYVTLCNVAALNCTTGIDTNQTETNIIGAELRDCVTGINISTAATTGTFLGISYITCTDDIKFNSVATTSAKNFMMKDGVVTRFMRNSTQGLEVQNDSTANMLLSSSLSSNAKPMRIHATTDTSHTTPSGGSCPIDVMILGSAHSRFSQAGQFSVGTNSPDAWGHFEQNDAANNSVTELLRLTHITSGSPGAGIGTRLGFEAETSASNNELGATIDAVTTNVGAGTEAFDLVVNLMSGGATASEVARCKSTGEFAPSLGVLFGEVSAPANPAANKAIVFAQDNGSGKTQLCVRFPSGNAQVIATEV